MPIVATPGRRRIAMAVLLALAALGAVIRATAPDPSVLRDIGTLLLVLWLPAVGNLIAWLIRQIPPAAPRVTDFRPGAPFTPHLRAELMPVPVAPASAIDAAEARCTLIVGRQGFTARLAAPVVQLLQPAGSQVHQLELLRPDQALQQLKPGVRFHLLVGPTALASGEVLPLVG
ncbi:MAG: hypothetical protein EOO24_16830 [Comamonadaceae bacterium]|nr:MAG: hypothetical protein EOO24_16830 [Comamonadaceae bacterium]